jgi:hypothetical protein
MVAFAPILAPRATWVASSASLRLTAARGVETLVNTTDGPTNTSSASTTPA